MSPESKRRKPKSVKKRGGRRSGAAFAPPSGWTPRRVPSAPDSGALPDEAYLVDVDTDDLGPDQLAELVARRRFAFPTASARIGGEDFDYLDPSDSDERSMLIRGEHPEYDDALEDPASELLVDGVNPRLHIAMHEIVANQLWDGDPPEVWHTAKRLLREGVDRHNVLHAIAEVVTTHMHGMLTSGEPFRLDRYVADLEKVDARRWR